MLVDANVLEVVGCPVVEVADASSSEIVLISDKGHRTSFEAVAVAAHDDDVEEAAAAVA